MTERDNRLPYLSFYQISERTSCQLNHTIDLPENQHLKKIFIIIPPEKSFNIYGAFVLSNI